MSLLGLPTELLDDIILYVYNNGDLESMALSCRRNYHVSKPHLKRYNMLRKRWRHVKVGRSKSILAMLVAIARDPLIARLTRTLDLRLTDESEDDAFCKAMCDPFQLKYGKCAGARQSVERIIRSSQLLTTRTQIAVEWIEMIMPARTGPNRLPRGPGTYFRQVTFREMVMHRAVFLLTLLPNLERLRLPKFWVCAEDNQWGSWREVIAVMANVARGYRDAWGTEQHLDAPLARLERLLPSQEIDDDGRCRGGVQEIASFLTLPGLRQVHVMKLMAADAVALDRGNSFQWSGLSGVSLVGDAMSNVRALHFEACCIDVANIARILDRMPALTSLKYSHHATWNGPGHNWDTGAFAAVVSERCGSQLTQLSLTVRHRMGAIESGIVSLHEFTALKEVQLDLQMFAAPPPVSDFQSRFRGLNLSPDDETSTSGILPLSRVLPIDIERVSLVMHAGHGTEHGQSELNIVRKQLRTLKALFAADIKLSHPCLQQVVLRHDGQAIDLGMHTIVGQSGKRSDVLLESQVARLLRGSGVVGVLIDDCHDAFELMPWEQEDNFCTFSD